MEAMEIALLQLKSGSPAVAAQIFSSVIESIGSHTSVEYDELRALALCHLSQVHDRLKQPEDARKCREKAAAQLRPADGVKSLGEGFPPQDTFFPSRAG